MLRRAIFLYAFFGIAVAATGAAIWQRLEINLRDEQLSDTSRLLAAARNEARELKERATTAERRVRLLEMTAAKGASGLPESLSDDAVPANDEAKLRTDLAAARQELAAAETAIKETEDRLASEIADHAALKIKAQELSEEVAATGRNITAIEGKAAAETTGSLPDQAASETNAPIAAGDTAAIPPSGVKKPARRASKPIIRAVKPIGSPFEPML